MLAAVSCTTSWLLLLPSCPHCLLFSSTCCFLLSPSPPAYANIFLVYFFLAAVFFPSSPSQARFDPQNDVNSLHSSTTLLLTQISNCAQTHTNLCLLDCVHLTHSALLPVGRKNTHARTHAHTLRDSKPVCLATCQPEGCDIVVRDPKEVDNSTASGMLGPEGKN